MSAQTPLYGLTYPTGADLLRDLPAQLQALATSIETALAAFDYNGADPDLVAARVAALETINAGTRLTALEGEWATLGYASGFESPGYGSVPAYRVTNGALELRGTFKKSSGNLAANDNPVATLPSVARPSSVRLFLIRGSGSSIVNGKINSNGTIQLEFFSAPTNWASFDNVRVSL